MESLQTDKKSNFFDAFLSAVMCKKINNCLRRAYTRLSLKTVLNDFRLLSLSLKKTKVIEIDESILFFFSPQFLDNGTEESTDNDDGVEDEDDKNIDDPTYTEQILSPNYIVYFTIQACIIAVIIAAIWISCASRAIRFRREVEEYERGGDGGTCTLYMSDL